MSAIILYLVQRVIFPVLFGFCIISRPAVLSIPYLVFLLYAPFLPFTTRKLTHKRTRCFLKCVLATSTIISLMQIGIQLMLYFKGLELLSTMKPLGGHLQSIGLTELYIPHSQSICWCFVMDVFLWVSSVITLVLLKKISAVEHSNEMGDSIIIDNIFGRSKYLQAKSHIILEGIAIFFVLSTLLLAATLQPSVPSALYFLAFLLLITFWAMNKQMYHGFVLTCRIVCAVLIVHVGAIFAIQASFAVENEFFHKHSQNNSTLMQLLGLKSQFELVDNNFVSVLELTEVDVFLNPIVLILCYYTSAIYLRDIRSRKKPERKNSTAIQLEPIEVEHEEKKETSATKTFIKRVYGFICRHSNIVSNVMMMLWSIVFRSWLSFVFLLIVIILWTRSTQRKSVHRLNLFIVLYSDLLMILQYICCIIPTKEVNEHKDEGHWLKSHLAEIGISRYDSEIFPCIPLLFQAICILTFCFTLRQSRCCNDEQKRASARSLQSFPMHPEKKATIWKCFDFGINVLTHLWVLLILFTMFTYAIWGKEANLMKLCYLVYVLIFIITYQLSLYVWRNMTYPLWMLVNVSANLNLILVYIYQFEKVESFFMNHMGINSHMQTIIGLHRYDSNLQLLIQLFYFTFLVVITSIQLLIFQDKYTKQFMWKSESESDARAKEKAASAEEFKSNTENSKKSFIEKIIQGISSFIDLNKKAMDWICRLLELHFFKVLMILGFLMSISEISFFNLSLFALVIFACLFETYTNKLICGIISLGAGIVAVLKILFELFKIPKNLDWLCFPGTEQSLTSMAFCDINSTATWIGVQKLNSHKNLIQIFAPYLTFLAAGTLFASVLYYQTRKRFLKGETVDGSEVLFENVTREDADKSVKLLIKYLFNYGFYKFGIEITLIVLVILISYRRDVVSAVYVIWLCIMFACRRKSKQLLWSLFLYFVTLANIAQYASLLNLPLFLKIDFKWEFDQIDALSNWLVLKQQPLKLLLDFLLLMCICRQQNVFRIEEKYSGGIYKGGRNQSTVLDVSVIISNQLPIRTHDYLYPTNWIDVVKCVVYLSSFWITLTVVLLTGTIKINLYSLGYLIASFVFCYIGTNFYMKPIRSIISWWDLLIAYNVFVIVTKSIYNVWVIFHEKNRKISSPNNDDMVTSVHSLLNENESSIVHLDQLDVGYDCLCFAFLIFQLRIFKSFDFVHMINESKATFVCDSRGTKLLEARLSEMHSIKEQRENETLEKIKLKVERIKANQRKFEPNLIAATSHQEATRYNGKYLYEEFVEKTESRLNDTNVESEESFLLKSQNSTLRITHAHSVVEPSTSKQGENRNIQNESEADSNGEELRKHRIKTIIRDFLVSITLYLYKFSRNYRFVHEILTKEKKMLKLKSCGGIDGSSGEQKTYFFSRQHSVAAEFCQALWFALIANTDVICYLFIFLNTIFSMSNWTIPMSLGVCLWATLTITRPSKRFWLTLITYIEVLVFMQCFLRTISHFHTIEILKSNATINLILLHLVLFHRSVQKHMGVWTKKANENVAYAYDFLNIRSLNATVRSNSLVQIPADVYTFIFLCDLFNFFVLMFGFSAFTQSPYDRGVFKYVQENQIPFRFLLVLLIQFASMLIDRALYLRRNMKGKIIFYLFSVIAVHLWQFHFIQKYNAKQLHAVTWPPNLFYFVKCIYFLFSAYQIRCGYPKTVSGNFATNGSSLTHCYQFIPFLSEARTLLDWLCIKTSLSLYEWFKMEDIYSDLYSIKCRRQYEKSAPRPRGTIRGSKGDYIRAMFCLITFFLLIWGPWAVFTFDNSFGDSNVPYQVSVTLYAGSTAEPIYRMTAQSERNIHQFDKNDFNQLKKVYKNNTSVRSFILNYDETDIAAISLDVNSTSLFMMSPPSLQKFKNDLNQNVKIKIRYLISVSRLTHDDSDVVEFSKKFDLNADAEARQEMFKILSDGDHAQRVHLPLILPKFLKVMNSKGLEPISKFLPIENYRNVTLRLNEIDGMKWWQLEEDCSDNFYEEILSKLPYSNCAENTVIYTFNDKLFPSGISPIIKSGILGLYSMYILLTWKFFRQCMASNVADIIQKDLPYVDRILQLCSDIYLVREQCDFKLEEDLYAKLIFLYRSPETMIRWTRIPDQTSTVDEQADIDESNAEKALRQSLSHRII
ncbi:piezo-type mechanosensitive ion channel component-like isoform X2 [Contarinia nasturtii]|uniref:piezo-type mechanosensitive ion channel component-like isoform X2 n=1 Tax=Contarinia nasturtii TaxID=265458 RepID=UPI0012D3F074|nr:piezo-type mechanosensitive ion channel component-like isoform X2 [Contarinia nasturtii]